MRRLVRKMLVAGLCVLALTPSAWGISRDRIAASAGHPNGDCSATPASVARGTAHVILFQWPRIGFGLPLPLVITIKPEGAPRTSGSLAADLSSMRGARR